MKVQHGIQLWIGTDLIGYTLACFYKGGKTDRVSHLASTVHNLYEGCAKDDFETKSMSLTMDWMTSDKALKALISIIHQTPSARDKSFLSTCFLHWLYDKQELVTLSVVQLENHDVECNVTDFSGEEMTKKIVEYILTASEAEQFIFNNVNGANTIRWSEFKTWIENFPGGRVSKSEYYKQRQILFSKLNYIANN